MLHQRAVKGLRLKALSYSTLNTDTDVAFCPYSAFILSMYAPVKAYRYGRNGAVPLEAVGGFVAKISRETQCEFLSLVI